MKAIKGVDYKNYALLSIIYQVKSSVFWAGYGIRFYRFLIISFLYTFQNMVKFKRLSFCQDIFSIKLFHAHVPYLCCMYDILKGLILNQ